MNQIIIRSEEPCDFLNIAALIKSAFDPEPMSDHREQFLVERLRKGDAYIPSLAMVGVLNGQIVGYIMLTRVSINSHVSLALAPVAVAPEFQHRGIGGRLIREAHRQAVQLGFDSVIVLGHKDYYPRFGYVQLSRFGISLPFDVPAEYCMAAELIPGALAGVAGVVEYPKAFFE